MTTEADSEYPCCHQLVGRPHTDYCRAKPRHRAIVVISLAIEQADNLQAVLEHLSPPSIPHFGGQVRIAVDPAAAQVLDWLDEGESELPPCSSPTTDHGDGRGCEIDGCPRHGGGEQ